MNVCRLGAAVAVTCFPWPRSAGAGTRALGGAASPAPYSIAQAVSIKTFGDVVWSRDGRRVAFVVGDPDTVESTTNFDVYLSDFPFDTARRLTRNPKGDGTPSFSPSGDTLVYVSTRAGDTRPAIWMMSLRGGDPWRFGQYDEAVGEVHWSPDGRWLVYTKNDTLPQRVAELRRGKRDPTVEGERLQYAHLWIADVATGRQRRLVGGKHQVWNARWSPDSKRIAFLVSPTGAVDDANQVDIGVVTAQGEPFRTLGAIGADFAWSPDSRWIGWASGGQRDQYVEKDDLWVCGAASGAPRRLTAHFDFGATTPAWSVGSDTLFFHVAQGVTTVLAAVPLEGGDVRVITDRRAAAGALVMGPGGRVGWVQSSQLVPDELWVARGPASHATVVSDLNARVRQAALATTRIFRWTSTDGARLEGVLLRPPRAIATRPLRTLVFLHGGPYGLRADLGFQAYAQAFACAGYQVFMPNFRSSGGYGTAFMLRQRADWGGQDWRDVQSGIDSLVGAGLADAGRLGIFGGSYGGYLTAWAITQTNRFKAAYMDRGIVNLPALWGQSDVHRYRAWDFGGRPWEVYDRMWQRSPIAHVERVKTPTLIIVGDNDPRTPIAQSKELYESLASLGVPVELVHYPREGHPLREPRHRSDAMQRALAWFDRWIR